MSGECARLVIMEKHFTRNSRKLNVNVIIYKKFNYNETTSYNAMPGQNELITSLGIYSSSCNLKHVSQPYSCSVWDELHWSNGLGANNAQLFKLRICIIFGTLTLMYIVDVINKILTRYLNFSGNRLSMALNI